ncbi:MAG: Hpt domain-containing protein [Pricia sp.]|nr:Hpt domain-containing protein [Pricia sp.]
MKETPNLSYITKLSKGDTLFEKKLLAIIGDELAGEIESYRLHLQNRDFTKTSEDVHKLCHKISILGMEKGYKIAKEYEMDLLQKNIRLKSNFEEILTSLTLFIDTYKNETL